MHTPTKLDVAIELAGCAPRERTLLCSLFKVSQYRSFIYREWKEGDATPPACLLIDVDDPNQRMRIDLAALHAGRYPVIGIGAELRKGVNFAAHIKRPVRWPRCC